MDYVLCMNDALYGMIFVICVWKHSSKGKGVPLVHKVIHCDVTHSLCWIKVYVTLLKCSLNSMRCFHRVTL